ncbi:epoxyqueuosine reductase [Planctomycetales bacterium]|nr:epoxyqueuosine reductase [Planctomycetales bacterium]
MSVDAAAELCQSALDDGFELAGVVRADSPKYYDAFERYLDRGMNAGMNSLAENRQARRHPESVLAGVQSVMMLGVSYSAVLDSEPHRVKELQGIAEYARGVDYHRWIRRRLKKLSLKHRQLFPTAHCRGVVDTAPILEKAFAETAGLGIVGKNTLLINPQFGSRFFLAVFLSTAILTPETKIIATTSSVGANFNPCGNCNHCIKCCPTSALVEPYILDARRCLNYWTIEQREELPQEIEAKRGKCFFGCDICQSVCGANAHLPKPPVGTVAPTSLSDIELREYAAGSPLERRFGKTVDAKIAQPETN